MRFTAGTISANVIVERAVNNQDLVGENPKFNYEKE